MKPILKFKGKIAIDELIYSDDLPCTVSVRKSKYMNNIIEQDHRFIKRKVRPMLSFMSLKSAENTILGIEIMHMIKKGQIEQVQNALSEVQFINRILGVAA